ncbi:MAG: DUF4149 domain-containing protein [Candidatus Melainabacteria bacterium]|nr:DUF4149 domain-containing protein [Candidatus Melainabacteria bacterium]
MSFWIPVGTAVQTLGLALMVGGMLALGAFTAPALFKQLARPEAAELMTVIFRRYDGVILASLLLVFVGELARTILAGQSLNVALLGWMGGFRYGLLLLMTVLTLLSTLWLNPQIESMEVARRQSAEGALRDPVAFAKLHRTSEKLYKLQLLMAVGLLLLTPFVSASKG